MFVHLATLSATKDRRRRWTGLAVALTVTFTVCDAQQIGLSSSEGFLLSKTNLELSRTVRPEQKTPPVIAAFTNPTLVSRKQVLESTSGFDALTSFRYGPMTLPRRLAPLCLHPNSRESTRGPPLMDPPFSC